MTRPGEQKPIKIKKLHREAAIFRVLSAVSSFLEDNPKFNGDINIHVVSFDKGKLKNADNEYTERLLLDATCVEILSHEKIQQKAIQQVLKSYRRIETIDFEVIGEHINAHLQVQVRTTE